MQNRTILTIIFVLAQAVALVGFVKNNQTVYVYETLVIIGGALLLSYLEFKHNLPISNYLRIVVFIAISGHTIGGELLDLYATSQFFDKYLHVFGTYSFALLGYVLLGLYNVPLRPQVKFFLIITIGLSVGTFYELVEFAMDQLSNPPMPAQSGLTDTNLDLLADLLGSILAALHLAIKPGAALSDHL